MAEFCESDLVCTGFWVRLCGVRYRPPNNAASAPMLGTYADIDDSNTYADIDDNTIGVDSAPNPQAGAARQEQEFEGFGSSDEEV